MSLMGQKQTNNHELKSTFVRYAPNSGHCPPPDTKEKPDGGRGAPREGDQTPRGIPPATGREIETARAVGVVFSLHFPTWSATIGYWAVNRLLQRRPQYNPEGVCQPRRWRAGSTNFRPSNDDSCGYSHRVGAAGPARAASRCSGSGTTG